MLRTLALLTQLVYHPAFDPYASILRIIRIFQANPEPHEYLKIRILDYYVLFPELLEKIRLTTSLRSTVRAAKFESRFPYDRLPSGIVLFERMETSFEAAVQTMVSTKMLSYIDDSNIIVPAKIPPDLYERAANLNSQEQELTDVLLSLGEIPLLGPGGLKDRTKLMDYRYDFV